MTGRLSNDLEIYSVYKVECRFWRAGTYFIEFRTTSSKEDAEFFLEFSKNKTGFKDGRITKLTELEEAIIYRDWYGVEWRGRKK